MFVVVYGTKRERLTKGWVAMACPRCQAVRPFLCEQLVDSAHIYFVEVSSREVGDFVTCDFCGTTFAVPDDVRVPSTAFWDPDKPFQELVDATAPQ